MLELSKIPKLANRKLQTVRIDKFDGGSNVLFSETRLEKNEAKEAQNLILIEDGIWDKRWGTAQYGGVSWTATIDGFFEYRKTDGTREIIVVADSKIWRVDPDAQTKTEITGATPTSGYRCYFVQINNLLYIANGHDALVRYNGTTLATYTGLTVPANPALARGAGLSAGSITYYYRVTATNAVGETTASTEASITVNKLRDAWVTASNEYLDFSWDAVSGAIQYIIYFSDTTGYEVKLSTVNTNSYRDYGTDTPNPYIEPPDDDQTTGPKFTTMWISGNRIWGTGDPDNPWRVYFTGTGVYLGNFSPAYGGGWIDLEKGGRATTNAGCDYQGKAHVFMETADGKGQVWQITLESQTIGDTSFIVPIPLKIISSVGTNAPRTIVYVENDVLFLNPKAVQVLGNEPGVLNVLRTNELSAKIRPYIRDLNAASLNKSCAYYYDAKVFFSVPTSSGEPNKIIIFDRERTAWIKDWSIGVSQFGEYTDTSGTTHLLGISGNKLIKFSQNYQGDSGTAFTWKYISPRIPMSVNWTQFAKIKRVYIRLRNTQGTVTFSVTGTKKSGSFTSLGTSQITAGSSDTGMGWDQMGSVQMGDTSGAPTTFADENMIKYMTINKLIRDIQYTVQGTGLSDRAVITGLMFEGFLIPTSKPSDWKLTVT